MASGETLLSWTATAGEAPATLPATHDMRNQHPVLDFDDSTSESIWFTGVMPQHYSGGGVTAYLHWSADGVITATKVRWDVAFERIGDGVLDIDGDGDAAAQSVSDDTPGTDGYVSIISVAFTNGAQMDSVATGELFRLKVTRDHDHADDDQLADAELHAVEIRET